MSIIETCCQSTGTVWLNYLDCSAEDEVIEDCSHRGWGLSYCSHSDDVGVVCRPNGMYTESLLALVDLLDIDPMYPSVILFYISCT